MIIDQKPALPIDAYLILNPGRVLVAFAVIDIEEKDKVAPLEKRGFVAVRPAGIIPIDTLRKVLPDCCELFGAQPDLAALVAPTSAKEIVFDGREGEREAELTCCPLQIHYFTSELIRACMLELQGAALDTLADEDGFASTLYAGALAELAVPSTSTFRCKR